MSLPLTFTAARCDYDALCRNLCAAGRARPYFLALRGKLAISSSTLPYDTVQFGLSEGDLNSIIYDMPRAAEAIYIVETLKIKLTYWRRLKQMASVVPDDAGFHSSVA